MKKTILLFKATFFFLFLANSYSQSGWISQNSGTGTILQGVCLVDSNIGFAVGWGDVILKTTNGGTNWFSQVSGTSECSFYGVSFTDANNGTVVGLLIVDRNYIGGILRTTNGGTNWILQHSPNYWLLGVSFIDANTGFVVGGFYNLSTILKTTNGGTNWISKTSGTTNCLYGVTFTDADNGTIVGINGSILRTTNGGENWISQTSGTTIGLSSVSFIDANTGFVVGGCGTILKTTNGGENWVSQTSGTTNNLNCVKFCDMNIGTIVGDSGIILRTTNGGVNWTSQTSGTTNFLTGVSFIDANTGAAVGYWGKILRTTDGGGVFVKQISNEIPEGFLLYQNYPNPFNPSTKIKFDIPELSSLKIIIYDLLGKEVVTLVNENIREGSYEVIWDASEYASGVYFYRIYTENYTETKSMILVK
ncbi:MAG: T9SS type A sorting domain-containing protein [Ignavibacteria bacterium]|nr:T9SS type A sorting domain-containing protein [Ignavibacteria bacterium]